MSTSVHRTAHHRAPVDLLILLASIYLGVQVARMNPYVMESTLGLPRSRAGSILPSPPEQPLPATVPFSERLMIWIGLAGSMVLPFATLGAALATFRHREVRSRLALRRIGHLTIAVSATFLALSLANEYILRRFPILEFGYLHNPFGTLWGDLATDTSRGVLALWIVLAFGGCWRTESGWSDRLGRALGALWIGYLVLIEGFKYFWMS